MLGYLANRIYFSGTQCNCENRLDGKIVVITGGNSGIGYETSLELAKRGYFKKGRFSLFYSSQLFLNFFFKGASIIIASLDLKTSELAAKKIIELSNNENIFSEKLDLANIKSIREFAERVRKKTDRIDILINNAGTFF